MEIEFDPAKSARNEADRGLSFALVAGFDWTTALVVEDIRFAYPEPRFFALGLISDRVHAVVFTPTAKGIRVISFRKANAREVKTYG
ncbi:MAG TPA: BrnT family toxin [Phenylobacterium sp.]